MKTVHPALIGRGRRDFKTTGCSVKKFASIRSNQNGFADFCKKRRNLWFKADVFNPEEWPCCYVIFRNGAVIYIGQTENLRPRIAAHRSKGVLKNYADGTYAMKIKLPRKFGQWAMDEIRLIKRLRPVMNKAKVASRWDGL